MNFRTYCILTKWKIRIIAFLLSAIALLFLTIAALFAIIDQTTSTIRVWKWPKLFMHSLVENVQYVSFSTHKLYQELMFIGASAFYAKLIRGVRQ